jgi:ABC-type multidrug transport system fused ATPase/permease subunit
VLIFDEATSALDAKTERTVQETIETLRGEHTILLVSHRLSTVRRADRIAVLEHGTIAQLGSDAELMAEDGLYRELALLQREDPQADSPA